MPEPSYFPLNVLESPATKTPGSSASKQPSIYDSLPPLLVDTTGSEEPPDSGSSMYLVPLRPQLYQRGPTAKDRQSLWRVIRTPLQMALLPLAAIGYLAFCYTVHRKVVPVITYGNFAVTSQYLAIIKGAITSINIIIISIALYPIYDVLNSLKVSKDEYIRHELLHNRVHGVPLETINHISSPSFGTIDAMVAFWRRTCSNHYSMGIVASLLAWVVATLAPGALSTNSVLADGEMVAFAIGAVLPQSVLNASYYFEPGFNASLNSDMAASITWAEMQLGVQYSFGVVNTSGPDYAAYIVPIPLDLASTTSARWLTGVIGINPSCSWAFTNITQPINLTSSFNLTSNSRATVFLRDFNLDVQVTDDDIPSFDVTPFASVKSPLFFVRNHTTQAPPTDGSTVFLLGQCLSGCTPPTPINFMLDLAGFPTFTVEMSNQTWSMATSVCVPNVTIETREVRNEGHGLLDVQPRPLTRQLAQQGNLHPVQTTSLFSTTTLSLTQSAGSMISTDRGNYFPLGSQVQGAVLYGKQQWEGLPGNTAPYGTNVTITLAPLEDITEGYTQIIQSAAKSYLAEYLGTAYVPGRVSTTEIMFSSSIPNVAVSTAIFIILAVFIILAQFRPGKGTEFTLINVAAAVHGSEIPAQFAQMKAEQMADFVPSVMGNHKDVQHDVAEMLGERKIFLQRRPDGSGVLHIT
ncbi:hypothetical protein BU15DRAFT_66529 [Melanogaster broomeanus]|nr:hypothetical protein BU15DRAFT_66529 [Melanogaster broomeanus]